MDSPHESAHAADEASPTSARARRRDDHDARVAPIARVVAALAAIAGLTASMILSVPKLLNRSFCAAGGGCDAVNQSRFAKLLGVPVAFWGLAAFSAALIVVLAPGRRTTRVVALATALGGIAGGLSLIAIQALKVEQFCPFCLVADTGGIVLGLALLVERWQSGALDAEPPRPTLRPVPFVLLALIAPAVPLGLALASTSGTHSIASEIVASSDGRLVMREFVDLECPFCRMTHKALKPLLAERPDIRVDRRHVPLAMHPHAKEAAVAACCAGEQGFEDRFVDAVISVETEPSWEVCRAVAQKLGVDLVKFDECSKSPRPLHRIEEDTGLFTQQKARGLPTIDFDGERFEGALDDAAARALLARHVRHDAAAPR